MSQQYKVHQRSKNLLVPIVGTTYTDQEDETRKLTISDLRVGDTLGREVIGVLSHPGSDDDGRDYACDLNVFNAVWIPKPKTDQPTKEGQ